MEIPIVFYRILLGFGDSFNVCGGSVSGDGGGSGGEIF